MMNVRTVVDRTALERIAEMALNEGLEQMAEMTSKEGLKRINDNLQRMTELALGDGMEKVAAELALTDSSDGFDCSDDASSSEGDLTVASSVASDDVAGAGEKVGRKKKRVIPGNTNHVKLTPPVFMPASKDLPRPKEIISIFR
jgi:hypothetical protein